MYFLTSAGGYFALANAFEMGRYFINSLYSTQRYDSLKHPPQTPVPVGIYDQSLIFVIFKFNNFFAIRIENCKT